MAAVRRIPAENLRSVDYRKMGFAIKTVGKLMKLGSTNAEKGKPLLITVAASHYCEKARWALDLSPWKNDYKEDGHAPAMQTFQANWATDYALSRTPILVLPNREIVSDSTTILHHLCKEFPQECGYLYPKEKALEISKFEEFVDETLGPVTRQYAYTNLFCNPSRAEKTALYEWATNWMTRRSSVVERTMFKKGFPMIIQVMKKSMGLNWDHLPEMKADIEGVMGKVNELLADGRPFLFGDKVTAADIAFAALMYPALIPPEMKLITPTLEAPDDVKPVIQDYIDQALQWQQTPAGELVLRLYRDHRFPHEELTHTETHAVPSQQNVRKLVEYSRNS